MSLFGTKSLTIVMYGIWNSLIILISDSDEITLVNKSSCDNCDLLHLESNYIKKMWLETFHRKVRENAQHGFRNDKICAVGIDG